MVSSPISQQQLLSAFKRKYDQDSDWGGHSGGGSDPYYTIEYRAFLDKFIRMNAVTSIVDIGCGDWQFSRFLNLDGINYLGLDIVPDLVVKNNDKFSSENVRFDLMPARLETIPSADLLIMKDVLQHLPDSEISRFHDVVFPNYKFCLLTNSYRKLNTPRNIDISVGGFRCLDLQRPPFNFTGSYVLEFVSYLWEEIRVFLVSSKGKNAV